MLQTPRVYIIFGIPGAGKGVCAQTLKEKKTFHHLSMGEHLRKLVRKGMILDSSDEEAIKSGLRLIACETVCCIVEEVVNLATNQKRNLVIDGFPRTDYQLKFIKKILADKNIVPYWVHFEVEPELAITRLLTRETCACCGHDFIMVSVRKIGVCDLCQGPLLKRETDNRKTILDRINLFSKTTNNIIEQIRTNDELTTLDANCDIEFLVEKFLQIEKSTI